VKFEPVTLPTRQGRRTVPTSERTKSEMAGVKQRLGKWLAGRRTRHAEDRKRLAMDPRPGLIEAKREEQTKLKALSKWRAVEADSAPPEFLPRLRRDAALSANRLPPRDNPHKRSVRCRT
jgi:hypothetical protein